MQIIEDKNREIQRADQIAKKLQPFYSKFKVNQRLLFSGHSHQCWPNVAFQGHRQYQEILLNKIDRKWGDVMEKVQKLRQYLKQYYDDPEGVYCRENNTHMLLVSWISSLDLINRPKIITTDGQFHSLHRQLQSLQKSNFPMQIVIVPAQPVETLSKRIIQKLDQKTSAVLCSRVFFESSKINFEIKSLLEGCKKKLVYLLIDDYHGTNVVPLSIKKQQLNDIFLVTGGYKYLQWGEGNCFLRIPKSYNRKPLITGWFASMGSLTQERTNNSIQFGSKEFLFSSATYEPISVFRAAKVVDFFRDQALTSDVLRKQYMIQNQYLRQKFKSLKIDPNFIKLRDDLPIQNFGGFVAFYSQKAQTVSQTLIKKEVLNDSRGKILRLGFAPYITSKQIDSAINIFEETIKQVFQAKQI